MTTVRDVMAAMEARYPAALADEWDAVGLTCGDPDASVQRILLAVDPVMDVVDEALMLQADMIVTHHPLLLRGVHSVAPVTHKGSVLHTLITHGIALLSAHTNADHADPGVSDALASALGVVDVRPIRASVANPAVGAGRIGRLAEPTTLGAFADTIASALPSTAGGVRVAGDPDAPILRVALCGGAGDFLLGRDLDGADVYVTSDLRHHRAQEFLADGGCALIDVPHWAAEWTWLPALAEALRSDLSGTTVEVHVSSIVTDPWTSHRGSPR
jgi:dinuclear metal center YbgI/SA1388 family protein